MTETKKKPCEAPPCPNKSTTLAGMFAVLEGLRVWLDIEQQRLIEELEENTAMVPLPPMGDYDNFLEVPLVAHFRILEKLQQFRKDFEALALENHQYWTHPTVVLSRLHTYQQGCHILRAAFKSYRDFLDEQHKQYQQQKAMSQGLGGLLGGVLGPFGGPPPEDDQE